MTNINERLSTISSERYGNVNKDIWYIYIELGYLMNFTLPLKNNNNNDPKPQLYEDLDYTLWRTYIVIIAEHKCKRRRQIFR